MKPLMCHIKFIIAFLLGLSFSIAHASTIYGVTGNYTGAVNTRLFSVDPDAQTVTILEDFDPTTQLGVLGSVGEGITADTLFVGIATSSTTTALYDYSLTTGVFTAVGAPAPIVGLGGSFFGTGGYMFPGSIADLVSIDPVTGASTLVGAGTIPYAGDIAEDPTTGILYGVGGANQLFTVNPADGSQVVVGQIPAAMLGLAFSSDGRLWASSSGPVGDNCDTDCLVEINKTNGSGAFVMQLPDGVFDLASESVQVVPVPPSFLLFGSGLLGLGRMARRKAA